MGKHDVSHVVTKHSTTIGIDEGVALPLRGLLPRNKDEGRRSSSRPTLRSVGRSQLFSMLGRWAKRTTRQLQRMQKIKQKIRCKRFLSFWNK
jgi:hypothetical protein